MRGNQFSSRCCTCKNFLLSEKKSLIGWCDKANEAASVIDTCKRHERLPEEKIEENGYETHKIGKLFYELPVAIRIYIVLQYLNEFSHLYDLNNGDLIDAMEMLRGPTCFDFRQEQVKRLKKSTGIDLSLYIRE